MKSTLKQTTAALLAGLTFALTSSLWASSGPGEVEALSPEDEALAERVAQAYEPYLQELVKPLYVYHYVPKSNLGTNPLRPPRTDDPRVSEHLPRTARYFWMSDVLTNRTTNVAGLYVALDPLASSDFGGAFPGGWLLYRIELPKGFRYIDTRQNLYYTFGQELLAELTHISHWNIEASSFLLANHGPRIRRIANRVIQKLRVSGFLYGWGGYVLPTFCGRNKNTFGAFVLTDTSSFERNFRVFSSLTSSRYETFSEITTTGKDHSSRFAGNPEYEEARMMSAAIDAFREQNQRAEFAFRPVSMETDDISRSAVDQWFHDHIFSCGGEAAWARPVTRSRP